MKRDLIILITACVIASGVASIATRALNHKELDGVFERGRKQGMQDTMKLLGDLGMEGKVVHMGLPIGSNRWMNMKYEVIHSGFTEQQASNLWWEAKVVRESDEVVTNSTSITISNAREKTTEAKEDKP